MALGCLVYPAVWSSPRVREVCEDSVNYNTGKCEIKWAYVLAIIAIFDIMILTILALVMSRKQVNILKISGVRENIAPSENISYTNDFKILKN